MGKRSFPYNREAFGGILRLISSKMSKIHDFMVEISRGVEISTRSQKSKVYKILNLLLKGIVKRTRIDFCEMTFLMAENMAENGSAFANFAWETDKVTNFRDTQSCSCPG